MEHPFCTLAILETTVRKLFLSSFLNDGNVSKFERTILKHISHFSQHFFGNGNAFLRGIFCEFLVIYFVVELQIRMIVIQHSSILALLF